MNLELFKKRIYTSLFLSILLLLVFKFNFILYYILIIVFNISLIEFINLMKKIYQKKISRYLTNFLFALYLFIYLLIFVILSDTFHLKIILFAILIGCVGSDIGGFIFGNLFKGAKLTNISPNKTISGAIGSVIFSCIFISGIIFYFTQNFNPKILIIGIITSIFCQLGDLFFSFLKRKAKIKDTGNLLPGHGGILDRIDGILLGVPFGYLSIIFIY